MLERLRRLTGSFRPPTPQATLPLPPRQVTPFHVSLASASTPAGAVEGLLDNVPETGSVLVLPSVVSRPGQGAHPHLVARLLVELGARATLAVPKDTPGPVRGRWERLARDRGTGFVRLGDAGWDMVALPDAGYRLDGVLLPAELERFQHRIAVPAFGDSGLVLGFLRRLVHPHTAMRVRQHAESDRLQTELASAVSCSWLLDATRLPSAIPANLAIWSEHPVSAELMGIAIQRYIDFRQGYESSGSWEHPQIQAAAELGEGPATGRDMVMHVAGESDLTRFIAQDLGCEIGL